MTIIANGPLGTLHAISVSRKAENTVVKRLQKRGASRIVKTPCYGFTGASKYTGIMYVVPKNRYLVQCVVTSTTQNDQGPEFQEHWIRAGNPKEAHEELLKLYSGLEVIDVFSENGNRCMY